MNNLKIVLFKTKDSDKFKTSSNKILDPKLYPDIFGDGSVGKSFTGGLNTGELSEIIFILGIYLYITNLGNLSNFNKDIKKLLISEVKVETINGITTLVGKQELPTYKISCHLQMGIKIKDMLFIGDAIFPGGNDYAVVKTGVDYKKVKDPEETKKIIRKLI